MVLAFVDVGWLGSPVDVGTFVVVVTMFVYELRPRTRKLAAAVVALAREHLRVDADRLQDELDVDESEVKAVRATIVRDGREDGGGS
ncbi:hypothetical protein N0B31_02805 [Salinirubellus salinus]|uniref:Uncharacterized protein n=1 Tax=Salinirubellus salinus TaxID=1364945 RepID=A0A9E7R3P1_9EURY|nr:hypothetical protein [Salinirubellus salinus]UWM55221.1 hypothetical protein N0B31_02805 [Salinirubellus salinus]